MSIFEFMESEPFDADDGSDESAFKTMLQKFPVYNDSPFEQDSVFVEEPKYVQHINFQKLINIIAGRKGSLIPYYYKDFESKATLGIAEKTVATLPVVANSKTSTNNTGRRIDEVIGKNFDAYKTNVDYIDKESGKTIFNGYLCQKKGYLHISKPHIGFSFDFDAEKRKIKFRDSFHYVDSPKTQAPTNERAIIIETERYEYYQILSDKQGLELTEQSKKRIILLFENALDKGYKQPDTMSWLYDYIPLFVLAQRKKESIINDLETLLMNNVWEKRELIILKLLNAFVTNNPKDQDLLLDALVNRRLNNKTFFELLFDKMNDWGGADNFSATIVELYKIWSTSSYTNPEKYKYNGQPETLAYQSKKILGFYSSEFSFDLDSTNVVVERNVYKESNPYVDVLSSFESSVNKQHFAIYHIFQPIRLPGLDQEGEMTMPDTVIPAFYILAFDKRNLWENFETKTWLGVDIITTLSGVGNLLKLRYLTSLSKTQGVIRLAFGGIEVISGIVGTMLNFVNNCKDATVCDKIRTYLFWLDLATLSADVIVQKMLRKTAEEAKDVLSKSGRLSDEEREVAEHLDEISGSASINRGRYKGESLMEADYSKIEFFLKRFKVDLRVVADEGVIEIAGYFNRDGSIKKLYPEEAALFITDGKNATIVFRKRCTKYDALHEFMHLEDCFKFGKKTFMQKLPIDKEEYVYKKMIEYRRYLTRGEAEHSVLYINKYNKRFGKTDKYGNEIIEKWPFNLSELPEKRQYISIESLFKLINL